MNDTEKPRLQFKSWKNQYIDLVEQSASDIISVPGPHVEAEKREQLRSRFAGFDGVVVEIGSGSGGHLIEQARKNPCHLHIGIELRFKRAFRTVEKAKQQGINNILMVRGDARLLHEFFEANEVDVVHINFPDPWDKPRWRKNRIINTQFITTLLALLKTGGRISHKSDHQGYFNDSCALLESFQNVQVVERTQNLYSCPLGALSTPSEFELLFKSQGLPIGYILIQKIGAESKVGV